MDDESSSTASDHCDDANEVAARAETGGAASTMSEQNAKEAAKNAKVGSECLRPPLPVPQFYDPARRPEAPK